MSLLALSLSSACVDVYDYVIEGKEEEERVRREAEEAARKEEEECTYLWERMEKGRSGGGRGGMGQGERGGGSGEWGIGVR